MIETIAALTFPPAPFLSHAAGEEGGVWAGAKEDGTQGWRRLQGRCYQVRRAALTFPPAPFRSRAAGEEGGRMGGSERRWYARVATVAGPVLPSTPGGPHLPPSPLPLPRCGRGRGRVSVAVAILRRSLLTRPFLPASLPRSRAAGEEGEG